MEIFSNPLPHRIDALLFRSELLGERAQTVYAACVGTLHLNADIAECGVADGKTAKGLCQLIEAMAPKRRLHLFDTLGTEPIAARNNLAATTVMTHARPTAAVISEIGRERAADYVKIYEGVFEKTFHLHDEPLAFVHADADLYESTLRIITFCDQHVVPGGVVVFDDYGTEWTGVTKAVDETLTTDRWSTYAVAGLGQLVAVRK